MERFFFSFWGQACSIGYWPLVLLGFGILFGVFQLRRRVLSRYKLAQIIDRRLFLSDSLSTAQHLLTRPESVEEQAARFQLQQAEELAKTVRVEDAFPFRAHRIWAIAGGLAAVSFGIFAIRYLTTNSLSLRPPLISFQITPVIEKIGEAFGKKKEALTHPFSRDRQQSANAQTGATQAIERSDMPQTPPSQETDPTGANANAESQAPGRGEKPGEEAKAGAQQDGKAPSSPQGQAGDKPQGENSPSTSEKPAGNPKEQSAKDSNGSPGLLNRMKDALSSLASKMQPNSSQQQQSQGNQNAASEKKDGQQQQASNSNRDQQGSKQQEGKGQQSDQNQTTEGQGQGQTAEKAQSAQGRSSDQSPQKGADAHSGVGRQDGDKDIKDAEQLKAMGKLADIIGKRSANVTGDMTVETSSGKQQLKTQYSQRLSQHSDSGGEINRNEIPAIYQHYVREYMEQVRKTDKSNQ